MAVPTEPIIYGLIFIAVLVLVEGLYLTVFGRSIRLNAKVNRRLELLEKGDTRDEVLEQLRKEMTQHMSTRRVPLYSILGDRAAKANLALSPRQLVMVIVLLGVAAFVGLSLGTAAGLTVRLIVSAGMSIGGVYLWLDSKARKRMSLFEEQLPDAVELMVRSLRVGHPFSSAISIVAREVADPLGSEFGVIADENAYGRDIGESLQALAERMEMQDLRFLAVAVAIQQQSGGNLAEILDGLAKVIRARFRLFRRVRAITAEAKFSGMILSVFPIVALVAINLLDPHYYDQVRHTDVFVPASLGVLALLIINVIFMRIMVNIKV